ncbi:MAG: hypothetical protein HQK54_02525 [Oligoflexales bacterium]|nr:hypothetical protein [Oligoflexales bacterium]
MRVFIAVLILFGFKTLEASPADRGMAVCRIRSTDQILESFRGVLPSSFSIRAYRYKVPRYDEINGKSLSSDRLRSMVSRKALSLCKAMKYSRSICTRGAVNIASAFTDRYQSGFLGSHAMALWFMGFDEDNWFSYQDIHKITKSYLQDDIPLYDCRREFILLKGIKIDGFLVKGHAPEALPVVIDHADRSFTILLVELVD